MRESAASVAQQREGGGRAGGGRTGRPRGRAEFYLSQYVKHRWTTCTSVFTFPHTDAGRPGGVEQ